MTVNSSIKQFVSHTMHASIGADYSTPHPQLKFRQKRQGVNGTERKGKIREKGKKDGMVWYSMV